MIRNLVAAEGVNMRQTLYVSFGITAAWPSHVAVAGDEGLQGQCSFYRPIVRFGQLKIERVLHPWRLDGHWDHFSTVKRMSLPQKMPTNRNSPRPMVLLMLAVRPRWSWSRRRWCPLAASVINARNPHWTHNSKVSLHNTAATRCVQCSQIRNEEIPTRKAQIPTIIPNFWKFASSIWEFWEFSKNSRNWTESNENFDIKDCNLLSFTVTKHPIKKFPLTIS